MGDAAWLRSAIGVADAATQALGVREDVTHRAHVISDAFGTEGPLGPPSSDRPWSSASKALLTTSGGQEIKYKAIVSFVGPVDVDRGTRSRSPTA
jgi:hypothetical protein